MALIQCRECNEPVSTEAVACPHCGAPQKPPVPPPLPSQPPKEEKIYRDNLVAITTTRVIVGGTTYALRNIASVSMTLTPPRVLGLILLLFIGIIIFFVGEFLFCGGSSPTAIIAFVAAGLIVCGTIFEMCRAKSTFHVCLASAAGEIHALSSKNRAYIEQIVVSVNEAIARYK